MNICIIENNCNKTNEHTNTIDEFQTLLEEKYEVDINDDIYDENLFMANCVFFNENYTYKQLVNIAEYYKIKKNRKKEFLINEIVLFEMNDENEDIIIQRKLYDYYIESLIEGKKAWPPLTPSWRRPMANPASFTPTATSMNCPCGTCIPRPKS